MNELLKPQKLSKCNLIQALEWIAFGYEPVRPEDEILEDREVYREKLIPNEFGLVEKPFSDEEKSYVKGMCRAIGLLKKALITGKLSIYSCAFYKNGYCYSCGPEIKLSDLKEYNSETISVNFSEDFRQIFITIPDENRYTPHVWSGTNFSFSVKELKKIRLKPVVLLHNPSSKENSTKLFSEEYTTPDLEIIKELLSEKFYENEDLLLKDNLVESILNKAKAKNIDMPLARAEHIATIIRTREQGRGGYIRMGNKKT